MSNTLVVGGNGYIGSHLKKIFPEYIYVGRKEFDLTKKSLIKNFLQNVDIDQCIILSAVISYERNINFSGEPFSTNLNGLNNLLELLPKNIKVVYFSSMSVYDENSTLPVKENASLVPLHSYGLSKIYAEQLIKYYTHKSIILRIPGIYGGDRKDGLIFNSIQKMKKNLPITLDTTSLGYWETMHIDDMLKMFSELIKNYQYSKKTETFNLSYGEKTDIIETLNFINKELKSTSVIEANRKYKDFYLSNEKILAYVEKPTTFLDRLNLYLSELQ